MVNIYGNTIDKMLCLIRKRARIYGIVQSEKWKAPYLCGVIKKLSIICR